MRFLAITRNKDSYYALPKEARMEIGLQSLGFVQKHLQDGSCKHVYFTPDLKGTVSVWELESDRQRTQVTLENPLWAYTEIQIQPLLEWDAVTSVMKELSAEPVRV